MLGKRYSTTSVWRRGTVFAVAVFLTSCSGGGRSEDPAAAQDDQNHAPTASNVQLQTLPASSLIIRVLDASTDADGDNLKLVYATQPAHGVVSIEDNGTPGDPFDDYLRYVCDDTFVGTTNFQYTISDNGNGRATGTVEILVGSSGNNPPNAMDDHALVTGASLSIDVLANDSDPDGDIVTISAFSPPPIGTVVHDTGATPDPADDRFVYTPLAGYAGLDSFTYTVSDGDLTASAVVSVEVGAAGATEQVCGTVMKGALQAALIQLFPIDDSGRPTSTVPVAQALTDANGRWCTAVPQPRVPMLVRSVGGQFVDETDTSAAGAGRRTIVLNPDAFLETVLMPPERFVALNVYTNAILEASRRTALAGGFAGVFGVERALYRQAFGWSDDLLALDPANPARVDPAASEAQRVYALSLGGIANVVNEVAVRFAESQMTFEMIRAVVIDLTDCLLDGHSYDGLVRTPVQFDLNGVPVLLPDDLDLNLSILRFRNNSLGDFGATPLAQIDGGICLGSDSADDAIAPIFVPDPLAQFMTAATGPLTDLLAVVPTPLAVDNFDPHVDVQAIAIATAAGIPIALTAANVAPGEYNITWQGIDDAGNTTQRVQRIVITANHDGAVELSPASIVPGTALSITVTDADLDANAALAETVAVTVTNMATTDIETVTLTETGTGTGVFAGNLPTRFGAAGTAADGVLDVQAGNTARARYDDAIDAAGFAATVTDDTIVTGGVTGAITMTGTITPGAALTITVTDTDLDTSAGLAETVAVTVTNTTTLEVETVTLTETGFNTGIFSSMLATQFGTAGTDEDGTLDVQAGEAARGSYYDALTAAGDSATVTDDTAATGGVSGTITLTPNTIIPGAALTITVTDTDLDTSASLAETVAVTVINTTTLEVETVTLTETGLNSGIFSSALATQFGTAGSGEDGRLDVQAGEAARGSYYDALTAAGDSATVTDDTAATGGVSGTISLTPNSITPGAALTITVTDTDLDTSAALSETVAVTVTNTATLEVETVTLTETGFNTGVFSNTLATQFGTAGTDEDGTLDVQAGEAARASYDDALDATGGPVTVTDDAAIVAGISGTIALTPATITPGAALTIMVTDTDLDTDASLAETVDITIINTTTLEIETVTLTETGFNTGVFSNTLATQFGTAGTDEDGTLDVQAGEAARGSYDDALDVTGSPVTVSDDTIITGGVTGSIAVTPNAINPGAALTITVSDTDLDTNASLAETIDITVSNTTTLEVETVTLTETGFNTGVFSNTLATQFGTAGTDEDGTLDVQAGQTARVSYDDALDATGGPATVTDDTAVTGGDDGTIDVTPDTILPGAALTITVNDTDLDTNASLAETVDITVTNTTTLEVETVTLTETGLNTGIFNNTLATQFGTAGADEDGALDVQAGQTARVSYDDALTVTGDTATTTDDTTVTGGVDGTIDVTPDTILPGAALTITVNDADLDTNASLAETLDITVTNTTTLEVETVTLTETGLDTGIFSSTLATQYGPLGIDEDGILDVQASDLARGSYDDALTMSGDAVTVIDDATITGGSNGTIDLAANSIVPGDELTITVTDLDLDTDPLVAETVDITVTNTTTLEVETVTLTETDVNTATFRNTLLTMAGTGGSDNDGILEMLAGQAAQGAYPDNLASTGAPVTLTDTSFASVGATDLRLTMTLEPPSTDTVENTGDTVNLRLTLTNDGPSGATNTTVRIAGRNTGIVFLSAAGDGSFVTAGADGDWTIAAVANGATATTVVTVRIDNTGYSSNPILAEVFATDQSDPDSTPANRAAAEDDSDTQTILLVAAYPYVWTGNVSTDFFDSGNWRGGAIPPQGARVIVPTNVFSRYPIWPGGPPLQLSRLAISAGASLDMNGALLEMRSSLLALGPVLGDVRSEGGGFRRIEGTMSSLTIDADVFATGSLYVSGDLDIVDDHFYLDGQAATVDGDLNVVGGGHLIMQVGGGLTIGGDVLFDGGGHNHPFTAGFLRLQGSFVTGTGGQRFNALPGHTTVFSGGAVAVELRGGNEFGDVVITDATTIDFQRNARFSGQLNVDAGSAFGMSGGNAAIFESALPIINGSIVPSLIDRFRLRGRVTLDTDYDVWPGILLSVERRLRIGPHTLTTTGDMIITDSGSLVMADPAGMVDVGGDFVTSSTRNHSGRLTAGTLMIAGDFSQAGHNLSYAPAPGHVTRFGGGVHRVYFESANSGFADLTLSANPTIQMDSDLKVFGQLRDVFAGDATISDNGAAFTLATGGVELDGLIVDGVPVTIGDGVITRFDNVMFTTMNPADDQLTMGQTAGIATFLNVDFDTLPTTGALLAGTDIGGAAGDAGVTIDNSLGSARPLHGTPWSSSAGGFVINWGNPTDDSDGDQLGDSDERLNNSNPLVPDTDGDLVGDYQEFVAGSDATTPDPVVFVDPNAIAPADGNSWASAWRNLAQAQSAGDLVTTGAIRFVLMAEVTGATGAQWQVALDGTVNNCDSLVFMGSLGDGIWIPQHNNGVPVTHLTLGGAATGSLLDFEKCTGVQLYDVRITGGIAADGGAIRLGGSSVALGHVHLTDNVATEKGGALAVLTTVNGASSADLDTALVASNAVVGAPLAYNGGGGIYIDPGSGLMARRTVVSGNVVTASVPAATNGGGGILVNGGAVDIAASAVSDNDTNSRGAGLYIVDQGSASGVVRDSIISGNTAAGFGGGVYCEEVTPAFELLNNIVSGNSAANGGGIAIQDAAGGGVFNNTMVYNQSRTPGATGAAIYAFDTPGPPLPGPAVADNVLRGNIDDAAAAADIEAATAIQSAFNITETGVYGLGDLMADPLFESGYYLTQATSPAVDHDISRDAATRGLELHMTDVAGMPDNNANLDAGYHYTGTAPAAVASIMIVEPAGGFSGASATLQALIIEAHDAAGNPLPAGAEVIIDNTSVSPVTLAPTTDAEPLGAGNGVVMTDLGYGRYLIMVDTSLVPAGTLTADIIVNRAAPQAVAIGIL